ncbi:SLC26A2, partial [Cordylochernes scorpioides]
MHAKRDYKIKECLLSDVIAGFTIAILQIPQGMAYGLLASVAAINGLYVSFFPILVYILMGTSRHISLGTFSIISMMIATAADSVMPTDTGGSVNGTVPVDDPLGDIHSRMDVLVVLALITGIFQMHLAVPLLRHAIIIGVVSYAIALSMGKIFAKKHKYRIRANQELIAMGTANVFCSFFQCYPCAVSVSRSLVQERAGGKTQVAGFVSCLFILVVLLFFGPFLYHLPKVRSQVHLTTSLNDQTLGFLRVYACHVALKGMFLQFSDFLAAWRVSKMDAMLWGVAFISTIVLDVDLGLLCGLLASILAVVIRSI